MTTYKFQSEVIRQAFEEFQASLSYEVKSQFNGRLERGLSIAHNGGVSSYEDDILPEYQNQFRVRSSDPTKSPYLVDLLQRSCTCPDHLKGHFCKHRIAANIIKNAILTSKTATPTPAKENSITSVSQAETNSGDDNMVQLSQSNWQPEAINWGVIQLEGQFLGVELLTIGDEHVTVRALPKIIDGKKLCPQFPFEGNRNQATILKKEVSHVKVFR